MMIANLYKRRMQIAFILSTIIFVIGIVVLFADQPKSADDWLNVLSIAFIALFMLIVALSSQNKYKRVKNIEIPQSERSILELDHLVLKREISFFPKLLLFEKDGRFIGTVKPIHIPLHYYVINLFLKNSFITLFPMTYGIFTNDQLLVSFKRRGMKKSVVTIKNVQNEPIGEYVQEDFKSLLNIKGKLKDAFGNTILSTNIKGFSGDFTLIDADGHTWAHFYNGYFPHHYTNLFRDMQNDIVVLSDDLDENYKRPLLAMICFLFLVRN